MKRTVHVFGPKSYSAIVVGLFGLILLLGWSESSEAQSVHTHPESAAMGKAGTASVTGSRAAGINPANLMLLDSPGSVYLDLLDISAGTGGDLLNVSVYNQYLTEGRVLTPEVQNQMLGAWFPRGRRAAAYAGLQLEALTLGLAYRTPRQAVSVTHMLRGMMRAGVNRPVLEAGFGGLNDDLFGTPTELRIRAETLLFHDITIGYARTIYENDTDLIFGLPGVLHAGIAPKLMIGTQSVDFSSNSELTVSGDSFVLHDFTYRVHASGNLAQELIAYEEARLQSGSEASLGDYLNDPFGDFLSAAGTGFGLNMGMNLMLELPESFLGYSFLGDGVRSLNIGLALTDIGKVPFRKEASAFSNKNILDWRGLSLDNEWVDEEFEGNLGNYIDFVLQDSLGKDIYLSYVSDPGTYWMPLPAQLSFGGEITAGRAKAALDFHKGFNNSGLNSRRLIVGTGLEYRIVKWLPLRAGITMGGKFGTRLSTGFGLHGSRFRFNTAFSAVPSSRNRGAWLGLSFNTSIRI